jgi:hypothetical protein
MESDTITNVKTILSIGTSDYWEEHYNFNKASPRRTKSLGNSALDLILINTVVPFLYSYGLYRSNEHLCERASTFLEAIKAENNYVVRSWEGVGLSVRTAADSQALLQLQKEYCDKKKCLFCRFGYEFLRN